MSSLYKADKDRLRDVIVANASTKIYFWFDEEGKAELCAADSYEQAVREEASAEALARLTINNAMRKI